jgi:8-oxo-dGTP diphosphatase
VRVNANAIILHEKKILLVRFEDENGPHYNLPGGGVDAGESVLDALPRECREEACVEIAQPEFLGAWEYVPEKENFRFGKVQKVGLLFLCRLAEGSLAKLPAKPDPNQVDVEWMSIDLFGAAIARQPILPEISGHIVAAIQNTNRGFFATDI